MKKNADGFTLIEILVALGILVIILVVGSNMFFTILKGSSKTKILTEVKQNGGYVINVMERMIRNAKKIETCESGMSKLKITNPDDGITTFHCCGSPLMIASKSGSLTCEQARLTSNKVQVSSSCNDFISCTQAVGGPPVVTINFTLQQAGTAARPEEEALVNFQTAVTLRNY
ncbi:MAG TPA: type II secretion system protein [Nevskiaceae bacterium]|nr:type II secretion system protein [Nevskiaceae bacterium]